MAELNKETFEILKHSAEDYISNELSLPEFNPVDEGEVFVQVKKLRIIRNTLIKYSLAFRKFKRAFSERAEAQQESLKLQEATILLKYQDELKPCKTKEEREAIIFSHQQRFDPDFSKLESKADSILLDVNIALQECQKVFDEYELCYNFQRTASMGYLLSQATSKLNDVVH